MHVSSLLFSQNFPANDLCLFSVPRALYMITINLLSFRPYAFRAFEIHSHEWFAQTSYSKVSLQILRVLFFLLAKTTKYRAIHRMTTNLLSFSPSAELHSICTVLGDLLKSFIQMSSNTYYMLFFLLPQRPQNIDSFPKRTKMRHMFAPRSISVSQICQTTSHVCCTLVQAKYWL